VPEENFWTLWCKGRLTEADTPTIWLGATPSGLTSAHLHHPPNLEDKRENYKNCSRCIVYTVVHSDVHTHTNAQFLQLTFFIEFVVFRFRFSFCVCLGLAFCVFF